LAESERRIRSIALVHETLSLEHGDTVDFDRVAGEIADMVGEGLAGPEVEIDLEGSCGAIVADVATPLAVVLSELLQNSVEHAFDEGGGRIDIRLSRRNGELQVEVRDDGRGLPAGFTLDRETGLGLQIARTLVESELGGTIRLDGGEGTRASVRVPLPTSVRP
jgi:two-component sensor histidine kinase